MSLESAEKTEENIQASDNTHEENQKLLNADDSTTGKSYSCMLKVLYNLNINIYILIYIIMRQKYTNILKWFTYTKDQIDIL